MKPMRQAFPPPVSLRGSEAMQEAVLDVYRKALQRFPREVLAEAYQMAAERQQYHCWPKCAVILAAAEALMPEQEPVEWVEKVVEMAHQYTERFMKTSAVAAKAREGGYEARLKRYVMESAYVQAQVIVGRTDGLNYDGVLVAHLPRGEQAEGLDDALSRAAAQAEKGHIQVRVPTEAVRHWMEQAQQQAEQENRGRKR